MTEYSQKKASKAPDDTSFDKFCGFYVFHALMRTCKTYLTNRMLVESLSLLCLNELDGLKLY